MEPQTLPQLLGVQGDDGWYSLASPGLRPALTAASTLLSPICFILKLKYFCSIKI